MMRLPRRIGFSERTSPGLARGCVTWLTESSPGPDGRTKGRPPVACRDGRRAACGALVHLPEVRPVNRALRWRSRIALKFWGSCPRCDREEHPHRKNHPEGQIDVAVPGFKEEAQKNL
jgi:hypothetical protein